MIILADDAAPEVTVVKIVLATVLVALAVYQTLLILVVYGKVRVPFLARRVAARTHRFVGTAAALLAVLVGVLCLRSYEVGDSLEHGGRVAVHVIAGSALLILLAIKILVVRGGPRLGRLLPVLGSAVLGLFILTWATSALTFLD